MTGCVDADEVQIPDEVVEEVKEPAEDPDDMQDPTDSLPDETGALKGRGGGGHQKVNADHTNFLLMWGCRPSKMVLAETTMVENIVDTFMNKFDRTNLSIKIPFAFEQMKGSDASFEMVTSNTV